MVLYILAFWTHHSNLCLHLYTMFSSLCFSVSRFPSSEDTSHWIRAHSCSVWSDLNLITSVRSYFQIRSHSQVLGVRTSYLLRRTQFNPEELINPFKKSISSWTGRGEVNHTLKIVVTARFKAPILTPPPMCVFFPTPSLLLKIWHHLPGDSDWPHRLKVWS